MRATGPFDVTMIPQAPAEGVGDPSVGRVALDKRYRGGLEATGRGEMLAAQTGVEGSAAYVALERVDGALDGKRGSFALVHRGVMARGARDLAITVVPDSGTGELVGLSGRMDIVIEGGTHTYLFNYELPG